MRTTHRALRLAACLALGLAAVGCGGQGSGSGTNGAARRSQYIASADRICSGTRAKQAAAHARVVRIARSSPEGVSDPAALLATLYQGYARVFAVQSAQLRRLGPPPAPAGPMVQFLTRSDEVVALLRQAAAAAGSGNLADSQGFEQNARGIAAQALQAAQLYGLKACGRFGLS